MTNKSEQIKQGIEEISNIDTEQTSDCQVLKTKELGEINESVFILTNGGRKLIGRRSTD